MTTVDETATPTDDPVPAATGGDTDERGRTTIATKAVERIAAQVVAECVHVGGTSNRVLGISMGAASHAGDADVTVHLHGQRAVSLTVRCSVPYPTSIRQATALVRAQLTEQVAELTGMTVRRVDITVTALTTTAGRRVQ